MPHADSRAVYVGTRRVDGTSTESMCTVGARLATAELYRDLGSTSSAKSWRKGLGHGGWSTGKLDRRRAARLALRSTRAIGGTARIARMK
jgi:hypothetical protein